MGVFSSIVDNVSLSFETERIVYGIFDQITPRNCITQYQERVRMLENLEKSIADEVAYYIGRVLLMRH